MTRLARHEGGARHNIVAGQPVKLRVVALDWILRAWFTNGLCRGMGVLTTTGRKSGKRRRHCVRVVATGSTAYVVAIPGTNAAWLHNIRANPRVTLELKRQRLDGEAREMTGSHEQHEARDAYVGTVNAADYIECFLHWRGRPTRAKIQRLHEIWFEGGTPIAVKLDRPAPQTLVPQ
jgi:deazaflavin-dependent oxidoreductase (nitroreductase family)